MHDLETVDGRLFKSRLSRQKGLLRRVLNEAWGGLRPALLSLDGKTAGHNGQKFYFCFTFMQQIALIVLSSLAEKWKGILSGDTEASYQRTICLFLDRMT